MDSIQATIMLLGLALGILYRTLAPYMSKKQQEKVANFDPKYIWTAIVAFIGALVSGMAMFPDAAAAWADGWPFGTGYFAIFGFGFLWAIGWNHGANRILADSPKKVPPKEARIL